MCEGQGTQTDAIFSHISDCVYVCVCVCAVYLPDLSGLEVVCMISHFPSSQCPHNQTFIQNIPTTSWEPTLCTRALYQIDAMVEMICSLHLAWVSPCPIVCCVFFSSFWQVPGQAVVSGKHQG